MVDYRKTLLALAAATFVLVAGSFGEAQAGASKAEAKCAIKLAKGAIKLSSTVGKEIAKCRDGDISGKKPAACPTAANQTKIAATAGKITKVADKLCKSVCSLASTQECVSDALCPPLANGGDEKCSAGAKGIIFDMRNIGFPGPYCDAALGHSVTTPADIADCVAAMAQSSEDDLLTVIYGTTTSSVSADAAKCLAGISKMSRKFSAIVAKMVSKCRNKIMRGKELGDPTRCAIDDPKAAAKIAKIETKLRDTVGKCTGAQILELDICGGGIATVAEAQDCLVQAAREAGDSTDVPAARQYVTSSVIDSAYPPDPVCGDNVVNQTANPQLLLGEECDGTDDSVCPGNCLPPGDLFQCTCGNIPRVRLQASHVMTDADAGWNGTSHEQGVPDKSGFITTLSNCDCDSMTGAGCTGTSTDPECDLFGATGPVCSWDVLGAGARCDDNATAVPPAGTKDGADEDEDCAICDVYSANVGAYCKNSLDCQPQCYDAAGAVTGPCTQQGAQMVCAAGEVCRGRCDTTPTCVKVPNGAPLPVSSNGAFVCSMQEFRTNITGTRNVVTGAHEVYYQLYAIESTGESSTRPCPVCGGFCRGGIRNLLVCEGRCDVSGTPCRFDSDCPSGETCSEQSPDCPGGGFCELDLICGSDPTNPIFGNPCNIEYTHPLFGTMSNDCPFNANQNITGLGFKVDYLPGGTAMQTMPSTVACTEAGFELYDCLCAPQKPGQGPGQATKPNLCAMACNAPGPVFGQGCANGDPNDPSFADTGDGTRCVGGSNAGRLCDEDADCPGSSCSANPLHCQGDPTFDRFPCTSNADCGLGSCVDACPGGRCVPLCVVDTAETKIPGLDGVCAAGPPVRHCEGADFQFLLCTKDALNGSCKAVCTQDPNTSCTTQSDCPSAVCNAGVCEFPVISCTTNADCPTEGPGLGCDTGSGTCIMPTGLACTSDGDCPACYGSCDAAVACEANSDGIIGTTDDFAGAGVCVSDNKNNCHLEPIVAVGKTTADPGFDVTTDDVHGVLWCYGSTQSPAINAGGGFGGIGRVIQQGSNLTNGFTSLP